MWRSQAAARSAQKAPLILSFCSNCTHVFNRTYDDELAELAHYEEEYENSQMFSHRFQQYADELADRLIATYGLYGKRIVEIGGGRGDFLRIICDRGDNCGVSFGPSYRPEPGDEIPTNVRFVADYYTAKYAKEPADLIICRHVLEHMAKPRELITTVREAVGDRSDLAVYFEVPNGEYILRDQAYWGLIYQHCSYFTERSLVTMFTECGFQPRVVQASFGDQFLAIEAFAASGAVAIRKIATVEGERVAALCKITGPAFNASTARWRNYIAQQQVKKRRIIVWGAGAKTVTFLNIVDPTGAVITHVVDVNPRKASRVIGGSGQQIVGPSALTELRPEVVVLMNPIYREEIASTLQALGLHPELLVA
jgi:2-polyprenyl-3-methyl-5-hydroxy-6-metoxy-1,4-benzoquinol methylase